MALTSEGRANLNLGGGSSINLRGLGADSTLVLVNGRRVAAGGFGSFVDVSTIPLSAIERIEVLADGASALYGSDAIGGVVNIILRNDYKGAEARARYGTVTDGRLDETQVGLVLGTRWRTGNALLSYEYYDRDNLGSEDREFVTQDLRPFGGDDFREPFSNPGNVTNFSQTFAIPPGQDGTSLAAEDLLPGVVNLADRRDQTDALPEQRRHSVFATASQDITEWLEVFVEGRYSERDSEQRSRASVGTLSVPASNPFFVDPFGDSDSVFVQYSFLDDLGPQINTSTVRTYGVTGGSTFDFASTWQADLYGVYSRDRTTTLSDGFVNATALATALADPNPETAFNPFGEGANTNPATIERVRGFVHNNVLSELWSLNAKVDGTLFTLPGGEVKLAVGGEYRDESLKQERFDTAFVPQPTVDPTILLGRNSKAAFAELLIPIVGPSNRLQGIEQLELSVAGRLEDYSDFGTTRNPKIGALWSPTSTLRFRSTYGTSFHAPLLLDLNESANRLLFDFAVDDPQSAAGSTTAIFLVGNNADLGPEEATTWTAGVDWQPQAVLPGLRVELTYFNVEVDGRVLDPSDDVFVVLAEEERFGSLITRNPELATVQALFDDPDFVNFAGSSPEDIGAIVDLRLNNIGVIKADGVDFTLSYPIESTVGRFDLRVNGSVFLTFDRAQTPTAPVFEVLDTIRNPADWRLRNSLAWRYGGFSATAFLNYTDSYQDDESTPERHIASWTTVDLYLGYNTTELPADVWWQDWVVSLSVQNLFDKEPPFANNQAQSLGYDPTNADPLGRFIALQVTKTWGRR